MPLSEASTRSGRAFVKAPREKDFEAGIYSAWELPRADASDPLVLVSDVVSFTREYRLLVLDGAVVTGSRYMTAGRLDVCPLDVDPERREVETFAKRLLAAVAEDLPSAVTVDVGWAVDADRGDDGFAVVEANMSWFSNIYGCDPGAALDVVLRSTGPADSFPPRDHKFARIRSQDR